MATNHLPAGQNQQPLHTLGERSHGAPCQHPAWLQGIQGRRAQPAMSPTLLWALALGIESQQCQHASHCPHPSWARGKVPCPTGVTGSRTRSGQHHSALAASPALLFPHSHPCSGGLRSPSSFTRCMSQLLQAGCRAWGLPPATGPCHHSASDDVPWTYSVLEQLKGKLRVPSKARHGPSFAACPVIP